MSWVQICRDNDVVNHVENTEKNYETKGNSTKNQIKTDNID